jgi:hypothetical protein
MKSLDRRIDKLEERFGVSKKHRLLVIISVSGQALDSKRCIQILDESGFVRSSGLTVVRFLDLPDGLDERETERFLRDEGHKITGFQAVESR